MIIDFHTHQFPDKIAEKTIGMLAAKGGHTPHTNGTARDLSRVLTESGVDLGIVLPVVTKPSQFETVNECAAALHDAYPNLLSFGGIHPEDENIEAHVAKIAALGLKGIKIHPDYQGIMIDDERYIRIAQEALSHGLMIVTHAGVDDGFPETVHCPPERARRFLDAVYGGKNPDKAMIVFAHGGANRMYDDAIRYLGEWNVYFDLAAITAYTDSATVTKIIRAHGAKRILFASDCPWGSPLQAADFVRSLDINEADKCAILGENARRALGI